jgi:hypothetical protein
MNFFRKSLLRLTTGVVLVLPVALQATSQSPTPDAVILRDGTVLEGLIVLNTVDTVVLVNNGDEKRIPKTKIARIRDEDDGDASHTAVITPGQLPPWRIIANDLRTQDNIRSVVQIPPMRVEQGVFAYIPYKSYRVNQNLELNIYGNPENPVALEIGIYDLAKQTRQARSQVRTHMAGFLTSRAALNALYALDLNGGKARAGKLTIEVTPPDAPDAFGSWWLSLYREAELDRYRLSPEEYAAQTIEPAAFTKSRGRHRSKSPIDMILDQTDFLWSEGNKLPTRFMEWTGDTTDSFLGFFRDDSGRLKLIPALPADNGES